MAIDLSVGREIWRGSLYEAGCVVATSYGASSLSGLPTHEELVEDLCEALELCRIVNEAGGWEAEDEIVNTALADGLSPVLDQAALLEQAMRYRRHRAIERQTSHSKRVKAVLGTRCMGCRLELAEIYGDEAAGVIDVHHLTPLSSLTEGQIVRFDPRTDFAVLCPNCHRVIHKLKNSGDVDALRAMLEKGALAVFVSDAARDRTS